MAACISRAKPRLLITETAINPMRAYSRFFHTVAAARQTNLIGRNTIGPSYDKRNVYPIYQVSLYESRN